MKRNKSWLINLDPKLSEVKHSISKLMSAAEHRDLKFSELIEEGKKSGVASDKKTKKEFAKRGLKF